MSPSEPASATASGTGPSPIAMGWRWPAEWEPHAATWLSWPHNPETWPGRLERAESAFTRIVAALWEREQVRINVRDVAMEDRVRGLLVAAGLDPDRGVSFFHVPTDDAWVRDHGPIFLVDDAQAPGARRPAVLDFGFNAWGGKYPPWDRDDAVPSEIARALGLDCFVPGRVLEGGSIDGNGCGTLLTTESCLLDPHRAPADAPRSRDEMEQFLAEWLGARQVLWLAEGIEGDDTDGHVDDIARFVSPGRVVAAVEDDTSDPNHVPLRRNLERLRGMKDQDGKPIEIVELPMPPRIDFQGQRCPASYANFYIANGVVLLPTFDAATDARAVEILRECLPDREIVQIPCADLIIGLGAVHCLTQQEPE